MAKTTPKPRLNVLDALPELADQIAVTTRIHPRRGNVPDPLESKIGGLFYWPEDEAWPTLPSKRPHWWTDSKYTKWDFPDNTPIELVPVLQINKKDVPDFPFPEGKDLFQLLWLPLYFGEQSYQVAWRSSQTVVKHLAEIPQSPHAAPLSVPKPCTLSFERVQEFPDVEDLTDEQQDRLSEWLHTLDQSQFKDEIAENEEFLDGLYQFELSVCPSNKLGGHVAWIQRIEWPDCDCGRRMEHLLTLTHMEVDAGTWNRWLPLEDREEYLNPKSTNSLKNSFINAPDWSLGGGRMYYFVCRHCETWPVKYVYQR